MSIFDIFSKEKRERAQSIFDYDACRKHREVKLLSFRQAMRHQYSFEYPDGFILANKYCRNFIIYSKASGKLQIGDFADDFYPRIEYITEEAATEERRKEVIAYQQKLKSARGNICKSSMPKFGFVSFTDFTSHDSKVMHKGYGVFNDLSLEFIYGAALFLNGREIALSTVWDKQSSSYFAKSLQKYVIEGRPTQKGISAVELVIGYCSPINEHYNFRYEILFDDRCDYTKADDGNVYRKAFNELNAFMFAFENEINGTKNPDDFYLEHPGSICSKEESDKQG